MQSMKLDSAKINFMGIRKIYGRSELTGEALRSTVDLIAEKPRPRRQTWTRNMHAHIMHAIVSRSQTFTKKAA